MKCPNCKGILEAKSGWQLKDNTYRRNRKCMNCDFKTTTVEVPYEYYHANNILVSDLKNILKKYMKLNTGKM
jgi:transcriptional regulator NrdR family protein